MNLMILDGNSIVNRAFYGVRPLTAPDGTPTNAVYGFLAILQRLLDEVAPDALCVAFDLKEPTFRHRAYEGYKAQRKPMPEELAAQMPVLKDVLDAMGIRRYEFPGYEADDILGTVSSCCEKLGPLIRSHLSAVHHLSCLKLQPYKAFYSYVPLKLLQVFELP